MMIGATLAVAVLLVLVAMKNFWIFLVMFLLVDGFLLYDKQYLFALVLFALAAAITSWQFYIGPWLGGDPCASEEGEAPKCPANATTPLVPLRPACVEGFYTLFTPFHREAEWVPKHVDTTALSSEASKLWRARKKKLTFGGYDADKVYVDMVSTLLLSRARILNIEQIWESVPEKLVKRVASEQLDMALVPAPVVDRARRGGLDGDKPGKKRDNLRFLANVTHYYMFCISTIVSGVQNIHQLERKRVGIPNRLRSVWKDIERSIFPAGHRGTVIYGTDAQLFRELRDYQIDAFFWAGGFPNKFIDGVVLSEITHKYQLVPVMFQDEKAFMRTHVQYFPTVLDLTHKFMPSRYLPTGLGRVWMRNYSASYWTFGFDLALICNDTMDNFTGYEIAKTIFSGRDLIARHMNTGRQTDIRINNYDQTWHNEYDKLSPADITRPSLPKVPVQEGAKLFYVKKGMISYCKEPGCMLTIGVERCKLCDNLIRKTEMQWRDQLMKEKAIPKEFVAIPFEKVWRDNQ